MANASPPRQDHLRVAARVAWERRRRKWSGRTLAERMTEVGCPMDQSAISKLEGGKRGISVEELVGFALVFQTSAERMLSSPTPEDLGVEIMELLERLHTKRKTLVKASNGVGEVLRELAVTVLDAGHFTPQVLEALVAIESAMVRLFDLALAVEAAVSGVQPHEVPHRYVRDV